MTNYNLQSCSSPISDGTNMFTNTYRPPSPFYLSQEMNNGYYPQYSAIPFDRMTPSSLSLQTNKINNSTKTNKNIKIGIIVIVHLLCS